MTAAFNSVAPVFSSLIHNPLGAVGVGTVGVGLFNGFSTEKIKENIFIAAMAVMAAWYVFPAFFAAAKTATVAAGTKAVGTAKAVTGYSTASKGVIYHKIATTGAHIHTTAAMPMDGFLQDVTAMEAKGKFVMYGGKTLPPDITIDGAKALGKAGGSFQIMPGNPVSAELGIPGNASLAAHELEMARGLAVKRGWWDAVDGTLSVPDFISKGLANEWCGVPATPDDVASAVCIKAGNPAQLPHGRYDQIFNSVTSAITKTREMLRINPASVTIPGLSVVR